MVLSLKYLEKIKNLKSSFNVERVILRNIDDSNNECGSMFNEFVCSNLRLNIKLNSKDILFPILERYLSISIVEHIVLENRNENFSTNLKEYESPINSLLNHCDKWLKTCEKCLNDKPICCLTCGLRLKEQTEIHHQCRETNLITHGCPCGEMFDDHQKYLDHIQPLNIKYFSHEKCPIPFPKCSLAGFHWLITWIDLACHKKYSKISVFCHYCKKHYSNFITWIIDYSKCIKNEMLMCQICSDVMDSLVENEFPKLNSIFRSVEQLKFSEINLRSLTRFFVNYKPNCNVSSDEIMSLIGFENVFRFELNKYLKTISDSSEIRRLETKFFNHRQQQLLKFFTEFPELCQKCLHRHRGCINMSSVPHHICRKLKHEEHVCVCTARFENHENYVFHRLYRCQFMFFVHISLLMIPHRNTNIYSLCNKICKPFHDIGGLRDHIKLCKKCHIYLIKSCQFCSKEHKSQMAEINYQLYFKNLLSAKKIVMRKELKFENSIKNSLKNCPADEWRKIKELTFYETKIQCLKNGPPFSLVGLVDLINKGDNFFSERKKIKLN